jgi:ribonuclease D
LSQLPSSAITFITSDQQLNELCDQWSQLESLAVDTEFMRTDTFYPIIALIQVSDGERCWLIDPLAISDFSSFKTLLIKPDLLKVFHACSEDLEVLKHALGVVPTPIFDTQVAAAFVGYGFSRGYSKLVSAVLGIDLDKHETRSDWLQRPLREAQLGYAAEDVFYLAKVFQYLQAKLSAVNRLGWVLEDMSILIAQAEIEIDTSNYYKKVKGAWQLSHKQLNVLQKLTLWREQVARAKNRPRSRIVPDNALLEIARCSATSHQDLKLVSELHPRDHRRYGDTLVQIVIQALTDSVDGWPKLIDKPLPRDAGEAIKRLRKVQHNLAENMNIAPEILAKKADLEMMVRSALNGVRAIPKLWQGSWRENSIGAPLLASIAVKSSVV